jgi:hypothetical protein
MRTVVASSMTLVLLAIVTLCPLMACPPTTPSCCHKPETKTVPDCPYSILQKSKTNPAPTYVKWVAAIFRAGHTTALPLVSLTVDAPCRLADASGLFLRNRVLLI